MRQSSGVCNAHVRTKRTRQGSWVWLCWCPVTWFQCRSCCSGLPGISVTVCRNSSNRSLTCTSM